MQHIVQIAFDFDDARVTKKIEEQGYQEMVDKITEKIERKMFEPTGYGRKPNPETDPFRSWVRDIIRDEFINYKEEIIAKAVKELVDSTKRTKAFKEKINAEIEKVH